MLSVILALSLTGGSWFVFPDGTYVDYVPAGLVAGVAVTGGSFVGSWPVSTGGGGSTWVASHMHWENYGGQWYSVPDGSPGPMFGVWSSPVLPAW